MLAMVRILGLRIPHFQPDRHGLRCLAHLLDNAIGDMFSRMHCEGFEREEVAAAQLGVKPMDGSTNANTNPETDTLELDDIDISGENPLGTDIGLDIEDLLRKLCKLVCSVRRSPKRQRILHCHSENLHLKDLNPILDVKTGWNSCHDMIEQFLYL